MSADSCSFGHLRESFLAGGLVNWRQPEPHRETLSQKLERQREHTLFQLNCYDKNTTNTASKLRDTLKLKYYQRNKK